MATFWAPSEHPSHTLVKLLGKFSALKVSGSSSGDAKVPCLEDKDKKVEGSVAIARYVATEGRATDIYPVQSEFIKRQVDTWMKTAGKAEDAVLGVRDSASGAQEKLDGLLETLDGRLDSNTYLVNERVTIADLVLYAALEALPGSGDSPSPLLTKYPHVLAWQQLMEEQLKGAKAPARAPVVAPPLPSHSPAITAPTPAAAAVAAAAPAPAAAPATRQAPAPAAVPSSNAVPAPAAEVPAPTPAVEVPVPDPAAEAPPPAVAAAPAASAPPTAAAEAPAPSTNGAPNGEAAGVDGKKKKKKKKGGGGGNEGEAAAADVAKGGDGADAAKGDDGAAGGEGGQGGEGPMDPEKARKKAEKAAAKEAKRAKAIAKAEAQAAEAAAKPADDAGSSKKAKAKAEAEAKKAADAAELARVVEAARATPKGQKKDLSGEMPKGYSPPAVEAAWYDWWHQCGFFRPDDDDTDKEPFVMVIPPPNVTGALHIGHALTNSIQDTIVRWRRMSGYNVLWVPGTDHAGIATQTVVEKKLNREQGISRHDIGREKFLEEVFKWVDQYRDKINEQLSRIGSSVDWERKTFTMDEARSAAVKEAFLRLFSDGLIYRDNRLVNWDATLKTAVSDIEVDYIDVPKRTLLAVPGYDNMVEFGVLTSFAYPLEDGSGEVVVATTRPETMLGDTAVAVHPEDPRYTHLHGKFVVHPVDGRKIPIVCDAELVDMSFGTGAVKITPAHDPNDFATGKRHNLEFINVLNDDGSINANGAQFEGQPRFKARETVVDFLRDKGLFRGTQDNPMRLGLCSRSKDVIEPVLKPQWWVSCSNMAAAACEAVRDGSLEIIPSDYEATWFRWLENIRDWCISRQLWWGHRIPAYYVRLADDPEAGAPGAPSEKMDRWVVAATLEEAQEVARDKFPGANFTLEQDDDVLDTWFSSGLFPFSVFEWPSNTSDLAKYYPTSLLETGNDILFFWVARMVMMGMHLTGKVPFKQVFLHSMVRDAHGRKMSKTLGNVIDPVHVIEGISLEDLHKTLLSGNLAAKEVEKAQAGQKADYPDGIEECGTDALRFALVAYTGQARDINLDIKRVVAYRHWCNKLWNAIRFAMLNLEEGFVPDPDLDVAKLWYPARWILSRLNAAAATVDKGMSGYDFSAATSALYSWWQYELCDVFIEVMKPALRAEEGDEAGQAAKRDTLQTLWLCLDHGLRLLHPFMPFVTEELWQRLPRRSDQVQYKSIMVTPYPKADPSWASPETEARMDFVNQVVNRTRKLRADYSLSKERPPLLISCKDPALAADLADSCAEIATLALCSSAAVLKNGESAGPGCAVATLDDVTAVHLQLAGILDAGKEVEKLLKKQADLEARKQALEKKMGASTYEAKTPEEVRVQDAERLQKAVAELEAVAAHIQDMQKLM